MKIYIAGRLAQRAELQEVRKRLWNLGHEVVSTWIDEATLDADLIDDELLRKFAIRDVSQISMADTLIIDTTSPLANDGGGGREFEYGLAFAQFQHKTLIRVGPVKNAFHTLVDRSYLHWDELFSEGV